MEDNSVIKGLKKQLNKKNLSEIERRNLERRLAIEIADGLEAGVSSPKPLPEPRRSNRSNSGIHPDRLDRTDMYASASKWGQFKPLIDARQVQLPDDTMGAKIRLDPIKPKKEKKREMKITGDNSQRTVDVDDNGNIVIFNHPEVKRMQNVEQSIEQTFARQPYEPYVKSPQREQQEKEKEKKLAEMIAKLNSGKGPSAVDTLIYKLTEPIAVFANAVKKVATNPNVINSVINGDAGSLFDAVGENGGFGGITRDEDYDGSDIKEDNLRKRRGQKVLKPLQKPEYQPSQELTPTYREPNLEQRMMVHTNSLPDHSPSSFGERLERRYPRAVERLRHLVVGPSLEQEHFDTFGVYPLEREASEIYLPPPPRRYLSA